MSDEKKYTAQEAALAVLAKAQEVYKASELAKSGYRDAGVKGVHGTDKAVTNQGTSRAGAQATSKGKPAAAMAEAVGHHKKVLSEIKAMPKPNLGKAEAGTFNARKESEAGMGAQMKAEGVNQTPPDGVRPNGTPPDNFNGNPAPGAEPKNQGENYKGHIKLAKFVGRMDEKRKAKPAAAPAAIDKAETGHEKGVHTSSAGIGGLGSFVKPGTSKAGEKLREAQHSSDKPGYAGTPNSRAEIFNAKSKHEHKKVLSDIKAAPKPNLGKAGDVSEPLDTERAKHMSASRPDAKTIAGASHVGAKLRGWEGKLDPEGAKETAKVSLANQRAAPKPKLPG